MKKTVTSLLLLILFSSLSFAQVTTIWEQSQNNANYPSFMGTGSTERGFAFGEGEGIALIENWGTTQTNGNFPTYMSAAHTERGFAFGVVGGMDRIFVVSRNGGTNVISVDGLTGEQIGSLDMTNVGGGTFTLNDAEVSDDGIIFACNLTVDASTSPFRVYRWDDESAAPVEVIAYDGLGNRFGDKFSVTGSASDNSLVVWAATSGSDKVVKFTTADNGATFTPEVITLDNGNLGSTPSVIPNGDMTEFYVNSNGTYVQRFLADGTFQDELSGGIVATGSNAVKFIEEGGKKYIVTYNYNGSLGNENLRLVDVTNGLETAELVLVTPTIGTEANPNGAGDVDVKIHGDGSFNMYILGTNNGVASYSFNPNAASVSEKVYVVSRNNGTNIHVLNGADGEYLYTLDMTDISGGVFLLNDAEVSDDGVIFACNLTTSATSSAFKVYRWDDDAAAPVNVIAYSDLDKRFGDKFTVTGSVADNSVVIWAVGAGSDQVVKFTTADNGVTFTPEVITLSNGVVQNSPALIPNYDLSEFYVNSNGTLVQRYSADGTFLDELSGGIVATGSNALRYFKIDEKEIIATYNYNGDLGNENLRIVDVTGGLANGALLEVTNTLGNIGNGNGTGDCDLKDNGDGTVNLYILGTNNGLAAYSFELPMITSEFSTMAGWNMVSVPVAMDDMTAAALFPDATTSIYAFDNGYTPVTDLMNGTGYWAKFDDVVNHSFTGMPVTDPVAISEGWNMIAAYDIEVPVAGITTDPAGLIASNFFGFDGQYFTPDNLVAGMGYWVKSTGDGVLQFNLTKNAPVEVNNTVAFFEIAIAATDGNASYDMMVGIDPAATEGIDAALMEAELPPAPPAGIFDSRMVFADGVTSSLYDFRTGDINMNGTVTHKIQWQLGTGTEFTATIAIPEVTGTIEMTVQDPFGGVLVSETIMDGETTPVVVTNTSLTSLDVTIVYTAPIPVEFTTFAANVAGEKVELTWETATETNNKGFEVERSSDDVSFTSIGFVDGNGTSAEAHSYSFVDHHATSGTYYYRLKQIDFDGTYAYSNTVEVDFVPTEFSLGQNYPNPFNPTTKIKFALPVAAKVSVKVYNVIGQQIAELINGQFELGLHEVSFNASLLSSGVYFYTIEAAGVDGQSFGTTKKMMLMK